MFKKLNFVNFLIVLTFNCFIYSQSDTILIDKNCGDINLKNVSTYLELNSKIYVNSISEGINSKNVIENPIIIICEENYLKLSDEQIDIIKNHLILGNLLLIDNYKSDYTFSIFLKKILPDYPLSTLPNNQIFKNYYELDFDKIDFKTKQIFINQQLRILAIKDRSILKETESLEMDYVKFLSSIILNFLLGN